MQLTLARAVGLVGKVLAVGDSVTSGHARNAAALVLAQESSVGATVTAEFVLLASAVSEA